MPTDHLTEKETDAWIKETDPRLYINPLPVRIWHWLHAMGFVALILTGIQIRYSDIINVLSFETAVRTHNWVAWTVIANYFVWLGFYLFSDKITNYHPELNPKKFFEKAFAQMQYYSWGIFHGERSPHKVLPHDKFNPMQSISYQIIMLLIVPMQFFTGIMMWDVKRFESWINFLGGIKVIDTVHVLIFIFFVSFIMIHAYLGSLGATPSAHFKEMFTGYEEEH
ncbi:MAG: cytochrome b/b6 domain-containing protein [Xanthomonadales bacterium]|nr:cytochrome b/b6 domain-containing protein [Xanthomonadales bacterium]